MSKHVSLYRVRLFFLSFCIIGALGVVVEVFATAIGNFYQTFVARVSTDTYFDLFEGNASLGTFLIYGIFSVSFFVFYPLFNRETRIIRHKVTRTILLSCFYALAFMIIEFAIGFVLRFVFGLNRVWDYDATWGSVLGLTTFSNFFVYSMLGYLGNNVYARIIQIDEMLLNPIGMSRAIIKETLIRRANETETDPRKAKRIKTEIERETEEHNMTMSEREQGLSFRNRFTRSILAIMIVWLVIILSIVMINGNVNIANGKSEFISDSVLITLVGTTSINIIGLFGIVVAYFFPKKEKNEER